MRIHMHADDLGSLAQRPSLAKASADHRHGLPGLGASSESQGTPWLPSDLHIRFPACKVVWIHKWIDRWIGRQMDGQIYR